VVLEVPDKAKIHWSGRKVVPLCGMPRDAEGSYCIFKCGQVIGIVIREGTIMKNGRGNGKTDREKIVGPLWNGTDVNCTEYVYYCVDGDSETIVRVFGAEREAVVHVVTAFNLAAQKTAVVREYR
jgi:hypothetical protein